MSAPAFAFAAWRAGPAASAQRALAAMGRFAEDAVRRGPEAAQADASLVEETIAAPLEVGASARYGVTVGTSFSSLPSAPGAPSGQSGIAVCA